MSQYLRHLAEWVRGLFRSPVRPYRTILMEETPDGLESHTIYVLGEGEHLWAAVMLCPCGCGAILHMSLHQEGRPRWKLTRHMDGTVSLAPSVWRRVGCGSHFFFRRSRVQWCSDANRTATRRLDRRV